MITKVHLIGYKRISRTGITNFLYTPDDHAALQIILGGNGDGKSSLFHEFWHLPANKEDYAFGGSKLIEGVYQGRTYTLYSTFYDKPMHNFSIDGDELNEDGKIEMCRNLCAEHLKVTNEVRAMALDNDPLTTMGPARRRYWMLKLADTDYTYAMQAYAKLKQAHSDATGMINRLKKRQLGEIAKLADVNVVKELTSDTHQIKLLIDELYSKRNATTISSESAMLMLDSHKLKVDNQVDSVDRLDLILIENAGYANEAELLADREKTKLDVHAAQAMSQKFYQDHDKLRKKYDILVKAGSESITQLQDKILSAEAVIELHTQFISLINVKQKADAKQMQDAFNIVYDDLFERVSNLKINDGQYSTKEAQEHDQTVTQLSTQMNVLQARMERLKAEVTHRREHIQQDRISCPNCKHNWSTVASEEDLKKADIQIENMMAELRDMGEKVKVSKLYLAEYSEYSEQYRAIMGIMRSAPILKHYFDEVTQNNRLVKFPGTVAADLHLVRSDLEYLVVIDDQKKIIDDANVQINLKKNLDADTLENIEEELEKLESSLHDKTEEIAKLNGKLNLIAILINTVNQANKYYGSLTESMDITKRLTGVVREARFQELLWDTIKALQTQLARKEDALAYINGQQQIVDEITHQLTEAAMNERVAKAAHIALSPISGAIAEGLQRFVNLFLGKINRVIGAIWTYPLVLQPFEMVGTGAELDYKFPFVVDDNVADMKKDVIQGSESMIQIFDTSFKIAVIQQLGCGHLPLFLDEFEAPLDAVHRDRAVHFIERLVNERAYGQVFMISHYANNHESLSSLGQTCILSRENLMLAPNPRDNEHVVMS